MITTGLIGFSGIVATFFAPTWSQTRLSVVFGNLPIVPLAYHKDDRDEVYLPISFLILGVVTLLVYRRLRESSAANGSEGSNWAATAAIVVFLVAVAGYAVAWFVPTEAESGVRRTIGDVGIVVVLAYTYAVGPLLGVAGVKLVRTRGQRHRAIVGFLFGCAGFTYGVGAMVACWITESCAH